MRPVQPSVVADRHHVMLSAVPSSGRVKTMIRITGIGDHDRLEWLIRINGIRTPAPETMAKGAWTGHGPMVGWYPAHGRAKIQPAGRIPHASRIEGRTI